MKKIPLLPIPSIIMIIGMIINVDSDWYELGILAVLIFLSFFMAFFSYSIQYVLYELDKKNIKDEKDSIVFFLIIIALYLLILFIAVFFQYQRTKWMCVLSTIQIIVLIFNIIFIYLKHQNNHNKKQ